MNKQQNINDIIVSIMEKDQTLEKRILEDYEKLNKKCEDVINKIKFRKVRK